MPFETAWIYDVTCPDWRRSRLSGKCKDFVVKAISNGIWTYTHSHQPRKDSEYWLAEYQKERVRAMDAAEELFQLGQIDKRKKAYRDVKQRLDLYHNYSTIMELYYRREAIKEGKSVCWLR